MYGSGSVSASRPDGTHRRVRRVAEIHAVEPGVVVAPGVERRRAVDAHAEVALGGVLEELDELLVVAADLREEVGVGGAAEQLQLLLAGHPGEVVGRAVEQLDEVGLRPVVERRLRHPVGGRPVGAHEHVAAERRGGEEDRTR